MNAYANHLENFEVAVTGQEDCPPMVLQRMRRITFSACCITFRAVHVTPEK